MPRLIVSWGSWGGLIWVVIIQTYKNNLKEHFLIHLHELLVPLLDISRLLAGIRLVIGSSNGIVTVVLAPLDHLSQDCFIDLPRPCQRCSRKSIKDPMGSSLRWEWE